MDTTESKAPDATVSMEDQPGAAVSEQNQASQ